MGPRLHSLLKQGERAARLGKKQAAEDVYQQAVEQFPDSAEAWLGLSQAVSSPERRATYYQRAQELDPSLTAVLESPNRHSSATPVPAASQLDAVLNESREWLQQATGSVPATVGTEPVPARIKESSLDVISTPDAETTTCFYHPNTETTLRCNRCEKPICTRCAISTPVGYRCKACIKEQQETFFDIVWYDYVLTLVVALPLALIASAIIPGIGWLTIFVAPFAGTLIAEAVRLVTRKRRGRWLPIVVSLCIIAGGLPTILGGLLGLSLTLSFLGSIIWQVVYLALAVSSAYYRIK